MPVRSLTYATEIDVLPTGVIVEDRGPYVVVRSPSNPTHFWGNFLLYPQPPSAGDRVAWEADFAREVGATRHIAFGWDTIEGELGAAEEELVAAGYRMEVGVSLVAQPHELRAHARASHDVRIRPLDPSPGADAAGWAASIEVQVEGRDAGHTEEDHRAFVEARTADRRRRFLAGDGAWYVAENTEGEVVAGCGVVVTEGRGRFQSVDTREAYRNQGIASRLVHDAGRHAFEHFGATQLVIVADVGYHALALYESLGFVARERTAGACWWPGAPHADRHPDRPLDH
jgi:ribosomal protein S18 acetylase RimI-like enzyme